MVFTDKTLKQLFHVTMAMNYRMVGCQDIVLIEEYGVYGLQNAKKVMHNIEVKICICFLHVNELLFILIKCIKLVSNK